MVDLFRGGAAAMWWGIDLFGGASICNLVYVRVIR